MFSVSLYLWLFCLISQVTQRVFIKIGLIKRGYKWESQVREPEAEKENGAGRQEERETETGSGKGKGRAGKEE